jgi:autotransporter-associated beta strand protein
MPLAAAARHSLRASQSIASLTGAASSNVTLGSNTLTVGTTSGNTTFAGRISGTGNLVKDGASTQILSGANTYTGSTTINAGNLVLGINDALSNSTAVIVSGGTLDLSTFNDTVGSFTITSGSLAGSGTLTASNYALQGGTIRANLGAGTINATAGTTALNGTAAATTIALNGGSITLGSAGRLASGANLTLTTGTLTLGGSETVNQLALHRRHAGRQRANPLSHRRLRCAIRQHLPRAWEAPPACDRNW